MKTALEQANELRAYIVDRCAKTQKLDLIAELAMLDEIIRTLDMCACCKTSVSDASVLCEDCVSSFTEYSDGSATCDYCEGAVRNLQ